MADMADDLRNLEVAGKVVAENPTNPPTYPSVIDRYYTRRYKTKFGNKTGEDHCILTHSNKISLITLAMSHPILKEKKIVTKVDFQVDKTTNRLENKVSGKGKRGAQSLSATAPLCHITCTDGATYTVHSCIKGNLVEVNENLVQHPELLTQKPSTDGYIAVVMSRLPDHKAEMEKLLSQEEYDKVISERDQVS